MYRQKRVNDSVHWYMGELSARVVAESGRACDRFHLGKLILRGLKDAPEFTLQIDGTSGKSESFKSVLERSVVCAHAMSSLGLKRGDVITLMAPNQLDLCIPYYAAYYLGVIIAPIDRLLQIKELEDTFATDEPKIVFCQSDRAEDVRLALDNLKLNTKIVTFDKECGTVNDSVLFKDLLKNYASETNVEQFKPSDFDPEETLAMLIPTSGTTGLPKQAAVTHKNFIVSSSILWCRESKFPTPTKMFLVMSPLQWLSAIKNFNMAPILRFTLLMSPQTLTQEHTYHLINTYKPTYIACSPTMLTSLIKPEDRNRCDFSSFELIFTGGSAVSAKLVEDLKMLSPKADICIIHGLSEVCSMTLLKNIDTPPGSIGKPAPHLQFRLINPDTQKDIMEPNTTGELWVQGPSVFKGYYKNEAATKDAFSEDGWFKTGDMFYRDENWNFYFSERMKLLLKYKNNQISPLEIENVIKQHPGVSDVAVTGIHEDEDGDLPVACVVLKPGYHVTAQEIKDLVKESLTDTKQLRGGVVFLDALPMTASTKVEYRTLKKMILDMDINNLC